MTDKRNDRPLGDGRSFQKDFDDATNVVHQGNAFTDAVSSAAEVAWEHGRCVALTKLNLIVVPDVVALEFAANGHPVPAGALAVQDVETKRTAYVFRAPGTVLRNVIVVDEDPGPGPFGGWPL